MHILNIEAISTDINIHCSHMTTSQMIIHRCSIEVYNDFASGLSVSRVTSLFLTLQYIFFCHSCPLFLLFSLALFPSFCPSCAAGGCWQKTGEKCSTLKFYLCSQRSQDDAWILTAGWRCRRSSWRGQHQGWPSAPAAWRSQSPDRSLRCRGWANWWGSRWLSHRGLGHQ